MSTLRLGEASGLALSGGIDKRSAIVTVSAGAQPYVSSEISEDLRRDVHGLLGIPIDATEMNGVLARIHTAAANATPLWISTPNLDFLASSRSDTKFRESLLMSDLCVPDGMPIVWISRLLGIPIRRRITGADIFSMLKMRKAPRITTFLFGGADGIAERASQRINEENTKLVCVGTYYPGFGPIEEMSGSSVIDAINLSGADILAVGLPARKGQPWLMLNRDLLTIPVRASLGATLSFQAGTLARAPSLLRTCGLEWLWRIKEEPHLWKRYLSNLRTLLYLLPARVFPLATLLLWDRCLKPDQDLAIQRSQGANATELRLTGAAIARHTEKAATWIGAALSPAGPMTIDMSKVTKIDTRFVGLLLMARKILETANQPFQLVGVPLRVRAVLRLNGFGFLLEANRRG